jgi:hypothetical protein
VLGGPQSDPYATPRRQNVVTPWSKKHPDGGELRESLQQQTATAEVLNHMALKLNGEDDRLNG